MKSFRNSAVILSLFLTLWPAKVLAQSISMTGPSSNVDVKEGDDYASIELQNPWDFNERRDIGWEENFVGSSVGVSNGVWSGTNATAGGYIFPLFPGFKGALQAGTAPGDRSLPSLGINKPINASRYTKLCFRSRASSRSTQAVYWANDPSQPQYWPDGSNFGANYDGYFPAPYYQAILNNDWQIYCYNMSALGSSFTQSGGSWSGNIHALRLDLSTAGGAGATSEVDWVRLVDPSSAPNMTITWTTSGLASDQMRTLYVDTDNSGFDGTPIARFTNGTDPHTYTINTAMFPPGNYYFYVTAQQAASGLLTGPITRSGYSARLQVNQAPVGYITSPSQTSGQEYAASEVGNAWDMDSATDVPNLDRTNYPDVLRQFSSESFAGSVDAEDAGKVFQAQANPPLPGYNESDDQVHMNVSAAHPIQAGKYRYLTYRIAADPTNFTSLDDRVRRGWVTRPIWWNNDVLGDGGDPGAHVLYEGWHTYAYDLWTLPTERGIPWTSNSHIRHLRIDPLETAVSTWFFLDWVRLYAENHAVNNQFTISWNLQDTDNSNFSVSLYYDTNSSGFDGTFITTLNNVTAGSNSYVWDTTGLTNGQSYWVYAIVSDGVNTRKFYSPVHVVIGDFTPTPVGRQGRAEFDYNGDAKSDLALYTPAPAASSTSRKKRPKAPKAPKIATSKFYFTNTGTSTSLGHGPTSQLFGADVNGDHWTDLLTVNVLGSYLNFTGVESRTAIAFNKVFGLVGDIPIKGDIDNDRIEDIGVYRSGSWYFMNRANQVFFYAWGVPGDQPVPADYDGDGQTDLAIWRPATGEWWILNSGFSAGYTTEYASVYQWGLPGDVPVQADYDGDGRDDAAVFRPSDGNWYVRYTKDGTTNVVSWGHGFFGDIPFPRLDINGDGKADYVVFRKPLGQWFVNFGNGQTAFYAFGTAADSLPIDK